MFVHVFGAYFGIAAARVLYRKEQLEEHVTGKASAQYISDVTSMIGKQTDAILHFDGPKLFIRV